MKHLFILFLFASSFCLAQNNGITYQAVIYNPNGEELPGADNPLALLTNKDICLRFGIIDSSGSIEYQENATVTTDRFGMVSLLIGTNGQTGGYAANFSAITWSDSNKSLKVDIDIQGGCSNFEALSNQPFTYVPFAYYSPASDVPGPAGEDGNGIENTINNSDNTITFEYTDGTSFTTDPLTGPDGGNGLSAYEVWLGLGNTGTEQEFITSLTGPQGPQGPQGEPGQGNSQISGSALSDNIAGYYLGIDSNTSFVLSSDGNNIGLTINNANQIKVVNIENGTISQKGQVLGPYTDPLTRVLALNGNGTRIMVFDASSSSVKVYDLINNVWSLHSNLPWGLPNRPLSCKFSNDGNSLVTIAASISNYEYNLWTYNQSGWTITLSSSFGPSRFFHTDNLEYIVKSSPITSDPSNGTLFNGSVEVFSNSGGSLTQVGQTIYGLDYEFLGDHSSINEDGTIIAVTTRTTKKVKIFEKASNLWIPKGQELEFPSAPEKAFLSEDGNELVVLISEIYTFPKSILRFVFENNQWNQIGSLIRTSNTSTPDTEANYENRTFIVKNEFDTEPQTNSDSVGDVYSLLIKVFE